MASRAMEVAMGVPALAPERSVTWPKRTRARLSNGLEVVLAEAHSIPKFHDELFFRSGNAAVADRSPGLAEMTATVVRTGTTKRASRQIEEDLRRIGADLSSSAGADTSAISFAGLSEFSEPLLGLVNEPAREAAFPEAEFERERRQKLEEVKLERTQPGFLASEILRKVLFGAHPYGQVSPSEEQVAAYKREDLRAVYREFYTPENGILLLVGDFDAQEMLKTAEKVFGGWTGKKPETSAAAAPANLRGRRVYVVHVPEPELADAQNYLSGVFSMGLATQDGLLSQFSTVALNELPDDYLETYRQKVRALTPQDLLATARKYLDSANMQIVVVGDRAQIESQAALFGELEIYDAQGKQLA